MKLIRKAIFKKIVAILVELLGGFLVIVSLLSILHGIYTIKPMLRQGSIGIRKFRPGETALIVQELRKGGAAEEAGIQKGDKIIKVNGTKIHKEIEPHENKKIWGENIAGTTVSLTIKRDGEVKTIKVQRKSPATYTKIVDAIFTIVSPLIFMCFVGVGLWGVYKNPDTTPILIALVCYSFGALMYVPIHIHEIPSPFTEIFSLDEIKGHLNKLLIFAPSLWVLLFLNFPERNDFYSEFKLITSFFVILVPAILILFYLFSIPFIPSPFFIIIGIFKKHSIIRKILSVGFLITIVLYIIMGITLGIIILTRGVRKTQNALKKRQYRLILFGLKYGALSVIIGYLLIFVLALIFSQWHLTTAIANWLIPTVFLFTQIGGLLIPFTFLNTFYHHKLLETESALKRRLRYWGATILLFSAYLLVLFFIQYFFITQLNLKEPAYIIFVVLIIASTFNRFNTKLKNYLDRKFYPEKTEYKESLQRLIKKMPGFIETETLLVHVKNWFEETTKLQKLVPISTTNGNLSHFPIKPEEKNSILRKVSDGSLFFWDEISPEQKEDIVEEEKNWAIQNGISITVPMICRNRLVGLLNVGKKKNGEDFTGGDLEIFREAAVHTALALENIKLQSEYLEKKRLAQEMEVAQKIQNQLMPQEIPKVQGISLFGQAIPCYEVAGDYFDIIPISKDKVVLAIGDVTGKGAGPALLMANLQACIRLGIQLSQSLDDLIYKINNIIYQNTSPEQFITFFIGIWDNQTKNFEYVNAGHNPPILISKIGKVSELNPTGMILGVFPDENYETQKIDLGSGDFVVIYTDGYEEAINPEEEEFGKERMIQVLSEGKGKRSQEIAYHLYESVKEFTQGVALADDLSIIVGKCE